MKEITINWLTNTQDNHNKFYHIWTIPVVPKTDNNYHYYLVVVNYGPIGKDGVWEEKGSFTTPLRVKNKAAEISAAKLAKGYYKVGTENRVITEETNNTLPHKLQQLLPANGFELDISDLTQQTVQKESSKTYSKFDCLELD